MAAKKAAAKKVPAKKAPARKTAGVPAVRTTNAERAAAAALAIAARAAEQAAPQAKQLFWDSIQQMSVVDVQQIYSGPPDAATRYFQGQMSQPLAAAMAPKSDAERH